MKEEQILKYPVAFHTNNGKINVLSHIEPNTPLYAGAAPAPNQPQGETK